MPEIRGREPAGPVDDAPHRRRADSVPVSGTLAASGPAVRGGEAASEASVRSLSRRLADYSQHIENLNIAEYVNLIRNPRRMFILNMISGIGRGVGIGIGFTLLGALLLVLLRQLLMLNLPHIGGFIAELVRIVQNRLGGGP